MKFIVRCSGGDGHGGYAAEVAGHPAYTHQRDRAREFDSPEEAADYIEQHGVLLCGDEYRPHVWKRLSIDETRAKYTIKGLKMAIEIAEIAFAYQRGPKWIMQRIRRLIRELGHV